jgi:SsrA-binding protein
MKIINRKAYFEYYIIDEYIAGIELLGSEVKSLRANNANITDAYVYITDGEVFLKNSFIAKYNESSYLNHDERRERKLLLTKKQINKLYRDVKNNGLTIVPLEIFLLKGRFKLKIALSRGKKLHDKKNSIKERDIKRETRREDNIMYK